MFGTVLYDEFTSTERKKVAAALEDLCSPLDNYGWASVGVYMFSKPATNDTPKNWADDVLYVGLARDLPERFNQHTGLLGCPASGCKRKQIDKWFSTNDTIRFSCFVQSPLDQSIGHRRRAQLNKHFDEENDESFLNDPPCGLESAKLVEGQLIETYRGSVSLTVFRRFPSVSFRSRPTISERDRKRIQSRLPPHCPS
ncbi:hypothetical protein, partial [Rhodococcus qingshengii]|uniref:hypothetical protein n=1 Tax=Rhodococcus qingshengii TaxID=334542 RepID=UPI0035DD7973